MHGKDVGGGAVVEPDGGYGGGRGRTAGLIMECCLPGGAELTSFTYQLTLVSTRTVGYLVSAPVYGGRGQ